jgi:hypothetical protein
MSSEEPPIFYFNGINFNNSFFNPSNTNGLTEAQANEKYLRKKTTDTATALENFNAGINTTNINPITTTVDIISGSTNGRTLNIMTASDGVINIGTSLTQLNLNSPIVPLYNPSLLTNGDIGQYIETTNTNNFTAGIVSTLATLTLSAGVWLLEGQTNPLFSSLNDEYRISLSLISTTIDNKRNQYIYYKSTGQIGSSISSIFVLTSSTSIFFNSLSIHATTSNNNFLSATRIA